MEDINQKIEEFENKYGMCELSVDDLENDGGVTALNTYLTEQITGRIPGAIPKPGQPV